jgi:hypothetical protein
MRLLAVAVLAGALAAGCATTSYEAPLVEPSSSTAATGSTTASAPASSTAASPSGSETQAAACPKQDPVHLPADLGTVTAAYLCQVEIRPIDGDGAWEFEVVKQVTSGLPDLLKAFAAPDVTDGTGACDAVLRNPLVVWLHGATTMAVRSPHDACTKPTDAAEAAYQALQTVEISATRLRQTTTQLAIDSNCSDQYKDMLSIEAEMGDPGQSAAHPQPISNPSRMCVYSVRPDQGDLPVGQLTSSRAFTPAQVDAINAALANAVVDDSCSRQGHRLFAVIDGGRGQTVVALDGCAVQQDGGWWRAGDDLRSLLS